MLVMVASREREMKEGVRVERISKIVCDRACVCVCVCVRGRCCTLDREEKRRMRTCTVIIIQNI